jgi:hypothetical protein
MEVILKLTSRHVQGFCLLLAAAVILAGAVKAQEPPQAAAPAQEPGSVLKDITYQKVEIAEQLQVLIKIDGPFSVDITELLGTKRLIIDFSSVSAIEAQPIYQVNDMGVLNIRSGQYRPNVARVVFDLADNIPAHSISPGKDGVSVVFGKDLSRIP